MRTYKRKTERGRANHETIMTAVRKVVETGRPCRSVADEHDIPHCTLRRYCIRYRSSGGNRGMRTGYFNVQYVFAIDEEHLLVEYVQRAAALYYGLGTMEMRRLAYDYAKKLEKKMPTSWVSNKKAGVDWLTGFLKRHGNIALRTPEATSLRRAMNFNRANVALFNDNLERLYLREALTPSRIWNLDETGCTTVQKPSRIIASTGVKQVGAIVSAERGQLVTMCCAVSAIGNTVPPMFVFPRVHYKDSFVNGAPPNSIGAAHPSGWMTAENFLKYMKHFVRHVRCSQEETVLLILDNHESHLSIEVLEFAKENGVVMLSFPPHTSHKLQPLDRSVYGPFKKYYNSACNGWIIGHPGRTMTIYDIPGVVGTAFPRAMTPANILSGFRVSGISPFDRCIFNDGDFLPSAVTEMPDPCQPQTAVATVHQQPPTTTVAMVHQQPPTTTVATVHQQPPTTTVAMVHQQPPTTTVAMVHQQPPTTTVATVHQQPEDSVAATVLQAVDAQISLPSTSHVISPEHIRPFPKACPRKGVRRGRQPGRTRVLTDTPEKDAIIQEKQQKTCKRKGSAKASSAARALVATKKAKPSPVNDDDACTCLLCDEPFSNSLPGKKWVQCTACRMWAHENCTSGDKCFVCDHCQ